MCEKRKAIISLWSQNSNDKDDVIEVVTPGEFYKEDDYYLATYEETELSGMKGTKTTFKIYPEKFSLIREGTTSTEMKFEKNKQEFVLYSTPHGILEMKIDTKKINVDVDDNGGEVNINYDMNILGVKPQYTVLKIKIRSKK